MVLRKRSNTCPARDYAHWRAPFLEAPCLEMFADALAQIKKILGGTGRSSGTPANAVSVGSRVSMSDQSGSFLLPHRQLDAQPPFDPGNRLGHIDGRQRVGRSRGNSQHRPGQADLRAMQTGQEEPRLAIAWFSNDAAVLHGRLDRRRDDRPIDLDQLDRLLHDAGRGVTAMPLAGQFVQRVQDGGSGPVGAVAVNPQLGRQLVGRLEADTANVVR